MQYQFVEFIGDGMILKNRMRVSIKIILFFLIEPNLKSESKIIKEIFSLVFIGLKSSTNERIAKSSIYKTVKSAKLNPCQYSGNLILPSCVHNLFCYKIRDVAKLSSRIYSKINKKKRNHVPKVRYHL